MEAVRHFDGYLRKKHFTIYTDHQALAMLRMQQNPKGRKARWIAELKNYDFKAKHWPGRDNGIADYLSRNLTTEPITYIEDEQSYPKYVGVVTYDEDDIWMSTRLKSPMKGSLQVVFEKSNGEESQTAARREAREEIGLELPQMQYLVTDSDYDCDIYICDIERFKPRRMEPDKAGPWKYYSWGRFNKMAWQKRTTPSLIKFKDDIIRACQFALDVKWQNRNNAQMRRREAKRKQEKEQLNWIKSPLNEEWHKDTQDWSQASTSPEEEELKIDSIRIEEENLSTYKNYIYREKNWECPICS